MSVFVLDGLRADFWLVNLTSACVLEQMATELLSFAQSMRLIPACIHSKHNTSHYFLL